MLIVGLDLSLTSTGIAVWSERQQCVLHHANPCTGPKDGDDVIRSDWIMASVMEAVEVYHPRAVAIEDYAHSKHTNVSRLGELGGIVKRQLWLEGWPFLKISSSTVKKFATGNGRASKEQMLAAAAPWYAGGVDDVADAIHVARCVAARYPDLRGRLVRTMST